MKAHACLAAVLAAILALPFVAAHGADRVDAPLRPLSHDDTARVIANVSDVVRRRYVFPDRVDTILARLRQAQADGRYERLDCGALADRISDDLRAASGDGHLYLIRDPARFDALTRSASAAASGDADAAYERRAAQRDHHGLTEMRILPGNVRYLKIAGFEWLQDDTGAAYDDAMRFLRDGDAIVIDLRGNGGGAHSAVRYLVSHFLAPETLLLSFEQSGTATVQSHTLDYLPAGRVKKPLYTLIDGGTASAAEDFAYQVQQFKLGTLVGERTAGAANNNDLVPISDDLVLSVSTGRPVHPVSHDNWEGRGVAPDIEAPPERALEFAQRALLAKLLEAPDLDASTRNEYRWAQRDVEARLHPVSIATETLRAWAGRYDDVAVELREGDLWLTRPARPTRRLVPLTADGSFAVAGVDTLRAVFVADGLQLWRVDDPQPHIYPRSRTLEPGTATAR
jgi:hypothetical protein